MADSIRCALKAGHEGRHLFYESKAVRLLGECEAEPGNSWPADPDPDEQHDELLLALHDAADTLTTLKAGLTDRPVLWRTVDAAEKSARLVLLRASTPEVSCVRKH